MLIVGEDRRKGENSILNSETVFFSARLQAEMEAERGTQDAGHEKKTLRLSKQRAEGT